MNLGLNSGAIIPYLGQHPRYKSYKAATFLHQSGSKMSLLARISQASQCKVVVHTVDPKFYDFVILSPLHIGRHCNLMVCRIIWADRVAPRGAEAAAGCKETGHSRLEKNT